jgi:hypothetical protein
MVLSPVAAAARFLTIAAATTLTLTSASWASQRSTSNVTPGPHRCCAMTTVIARWITHLSAVHAVAGPPEGTGEGLYLCAGRLAAGPQAV